ncbi:MAG: iron-containing redox enzyme family protein [Pseudomonadota bacterium]
MSSEPMKRISAGELTTEEYGSILREVFHYSRENPQLKAAACMYLRGRERDLVSSMFRHATAEVGHENLAMNDIISLGMNVDALPYENPLSATSLMTAYAYYQIHRMNPAGYIGYGFFLEFLPTTVGSDIILTLKKSGIPENSLSFLIDHAEIDVSHTRLVERYVDAFGRTDAEISSMGYVIETTGYMFAKLFEQAIEFAHAPWERGWNWQELIADSLTPEMVISGEAKRQTA